MMILGFLAIGFLFYLALNKQKSATQNYAVSQAVNSEALKIAKGRLARGEITVNEFEQIRANLFK